MRKIAKRAESPMTSIAQGKRSDTLGKPSHPITPRPARTTVNITRSISMLLPLQGALLIHRYPPGRRFACRWAMNFCPFGTSPLKRALIERFSACERIRVDLCDLWACSPNCLFKRIEHLVFTPTDLPDLHRCVAFRMRRNPCASVKLPPVRSVGLRRVIFF